MTQSPFLNDCDGDALPPKAIPQRSVSVQPIKIDCDCSRGRGNFDEGNENDYDKLPKNYERKANYNHKQQYKERPPLIKSVSMDIKDPFRYTPGASDEIPQPEQPIQNNTSPTSPVPQSPSSSSPKRVSSFQNNNNKQTNDNRTVTFGGKEVDDHKSNHPRRRGPNKDRGGSNYNKNNDNFNNRGGGNRNRSRGIPHSTSLTLTIGSKFQQGQPQANQPDPYINHANPPPPLPSQSPKISSSQSSTVIPTKVKEWKPNK